MFWKYAANLRQCQSVISICEITLRDGCSPVNLLHILETPFLKNTSGWLLLNVFFDETTEKRKLEKCVLGTRVSAPKPVYRSHKQPGYVTGVFEPSLRNLRARLWTCCTIWISGSGSKLQWIMCSMLSGAGSYVKFKQINYCRRWDLIFVVKIC